KHKNKKEVINNTILFLMMICAVFIGLVYVFKNYLVSRLVLQKVIVDFLIWILVLDALVIIPFAVLSREKTPITYSAIKIAYVLINTGLTVVLLYLIPAYPPNHTESSQNRLFIPNLDVGYLFVSNLVASLSTH